MSDPETMTLDDYLAASGRRYMAKLRAKKPRAPRDLSKPKAKRASPERDAQKLVVKWFRGWGWSVQASFTEQGAASKDPTKRARFGAARKATGATTGWPDLTCISPAGHTVYVEMKSPAGKLSPAHVAVHAELRGRGCVVVLGRDVASVRDALLAEGVVVDMRPALPAQGLHP